MKIWKKIFTIGFTAPTTLSIITPICSCSNNKFNEYFISYSTNYFSDWFNSITDDQNWDWWTSDDTKCSTEAQAIMMYSYGGGWDTWNWRLHKYGESGISEEEEKENADATLSLPYNHIGTGNQYKEKKTKINVGSYKLVESALNKATCGKTTIYSGSEFDQVDLFSQINTLIDAPEGYSFKDTDPSKYRQLPIQNLINKTITNYGFMSTSLKREWAWHFTYNQYSIGFKNGIFYEIAIDENTKGGIVSDWNHTFGKNQIMLGRMEEYQMIVQRKLKIKILDAYWTNTIAGNNVLYLKCKGWHE